jgi:hypothetical protein
MYKIVYLQQLYIELLLITQKYEFYYRYRPYHNKLTKIWPQVVRIVQFVIDFENLILIDSRQNRFSAIWQLKLLCRSKATHHKCP